MANIKTENLSQLTNGGQLLQTQATDASVVSTIVITNPEHNQTIKYDGVEKKWIDKGIVADSTVVTPPVVIPPVVDPTIPAINKPVLTFIDDDGSNLAYSRLYAICKRKGITATFAVVSDWVGGGNLTIDQLKQMKSEGFTIASHSKTHNESYFNTNLAGTPDSVFATEFSASKQWFADNGLGDINTIVYPNGNFVTHAGVGQDVRIEGIADDYYTYGVNADGWYNTNLDNPMYLKRWFPDLQYGNTMDQVYETLNYCKNDKGWMIIGVHCANIYQLPDAQIEAIIDYALANGFEIMNFHDAVNFKKSIYGTPVTPEDPTEPETPVTTSIMEGTWLGDWPNATKANIPPLNTQIGRNEKIIHTFINTNHQFNAFNGVLDYVDANGAINLLTMELTKPDGNTGYSTVEVNSGVLDSYFTTIATALKSWKSGKEILFRLMHEVNGNWYGWCVGKDTGVNTNETYIAAYRRIVNIFRNAGATNVKFIYNVNNTNCGNGSSFVGAFPGDDYIDYISLDGYNWGTSQSWGSHWETFDQVFSAAYTALINVSTKPVLIAEYASTELGGDKAAWITDAMVQMKSAKYNRIKGAVWFNSNKETDWRINSSDASLTAYKNLIF